MRLGVATKIFLGFAVVTAAFGASNVYTLVRMSELRGSLTLIWRDVIPIANDLRALSRRLRSPDEFLDFKRASDRVWIQRLLPAIEAFDRLEDVEASLKRAISRRALDAQDRAVLRETLDRLKRFHRTSELAGSVAVEGLDPMEASPDGRRPTNAMVYDWLIRRTTRMANEGMLEGTEPETRATTRMLRQLDREVVDAERRLSRPIREMNLRVVEEEQAASLAAIGVAIMALLTTLAMMGMAQLALRPLIRVREGAQRIAAGRYAERLGVRSRDEIGDLAREFDTMAEALVARERKLAEQREELLRADRLATVGKVAAQITHEVRNPLSSIGLNAELLEEEVERLIDGETLDEGEQAEVTALFGAIQQEIGRLKAITEEYLRYARMPSPAPEQVDLGALVDETVRFLRYELAEAGVEVVRGEGVAAAGEGGPEPVMADGDQLRQALVNLLRNAKEAMADAVAEAEAAGGVRPATELRLEVVDLAGFDRVQVTVEDSGPGVPQDLLARLFEPFVTSKSSGTGLGLPLTQQIVREHGGDVSVVSPLGPAGGTRFTVVLPRRGPSGDVVAGEALGVGSATGP